MTTSARGESSTWTVQDSSGPPVGRQQERSALSTRRLLEACAALIVERGYERTTLADVGKRAGYSQGLVTRRFGSKSRLLVVLVERMTSRFGHARITETTGGRSGAAAVTHLIREIGQDARRDPDGLRSFYALMFEGVKPVPELHERLRDLNRTFRRDIADILERGLAEGSVRPGTDPTAAANLVASSLRGVAYFWLLDPEEFDVVGELSALAGQLETLLAPVEASTCCEVPGAAPAR